MQGTTENEWVENSQEKSVGDTVNVVLLSGDQLCTENVHRGIVFWCIPISGMISVTVHFRRYRELAQGKRHLQ
jgi:hypothetical protein